MKIRSNIQFNTVSSENDVFVFGRIAVLVCCCMCCTDTGGLTKDFI